MACSIHQEAKTVLPARTLYLWLGDLYPYQTSPLQKQATENKNSQKALFLEFSYACSEESCCSRRAIVCASWAWLTATVKSPRVFSRIPRTESVVRRKLPVIASGKSSVVSAR